MSFKNYNIKNDYLIIEDLVDAEIYYKSSIDSNFVKYSGIIAGERIKLEKTGWYYIAPSHNDTSTHADSEIFFHLTCQDAAELQSELKQKYKKSETYISSDLEYFSPPYPHKDFLLANLNLSDNDCALLDFQELQIKKNHCTLYLKNANDFKNFVFSGYAFTEDELVYGDRDLNHINSKKLSDSVGIFAFADVHDNGVEIFSDYFGFQKIFYYKKNDVFVISNRYHLLLIFLHLAKVKLTLSQKNICALFLSNVTLFRQIYSNNLLIDDTHILDFREKIAVDSNGFRIIETNKISGIEKNLQFDENIYRNLIETSASEIVANVKKAVAHEKFSTISCDLSGGRDSRVNYAVLSHLPSDLKKKISIRTTLAESADLESAIPVNNLYKFPYYSRPETIEYGDIDDYINIKRSQFLGYHYLVRPEQFISL